MPREIVKFPLCLSWHFHDESFMRVQLQFKDSPHLHHPAISFLDNGLIKIYLCKNYDNEIHNCISYHINRYLI